MISAVEQNFKPLLNFAAQKVIRRPSCGLCGHYNCSEASPLLQNVHKNRNINVSVLLQVVLVDVTCAAFVVF